MTRPALTREATLGTERAGVRYATPPRHDLRMHVDAYQRTGWENAPIEAMDDDPTGQHFMRGLANGLAITAMAAAFVLFAVVPLVRWVVA